MISVRKIIMGGIWIIFAWVFILPAGIAAAQDSEETFYPDVSIASCELSADFTKVMDRLSDGRLNPNLVVDWYGRTVMHLVAPASLDLLRMAVAKGGDCGVVINIGLTPLHHAAMSWEFDPGPESMRILVDGGESVTTTVRVGDRVWIEMSDGKAEFVHASKLAKSVGPAVGERFSDCSVCPEMVVVPAGSFLMGSPSSEEERLDNEGPVHRVTIPQPFAVGRYEVTFDQWDACVSEGGCSHVPHDAGWGRGNRPVVNVNWHDAGEYVDWLSHKTGKRYRLLSEAEWEYAARAGTRGPFHFGRTISTDQANYMGFYTYGGAAREYIVEEPNLSAESPAMHSDCMMSMETYGNGWRIAGMAITRVHRRMVVPGLRALTVIYACCVAVPGARNRETCVRRIAAGSEPGAGTASSGSVLPGRLHLESLHLYFGVPRGGGPWSNISQV